MNVSDIQLQSDKLAAAHLLFPEAAVAPDVRRGLLRLLSNIYGEFDPGSG